MKAEWIAQFANVTQEKVNEKEEISIKYEKRIKEIEMEYSKQIYELKNQLSLSKGANETLIS